MQQKKCSKCGHKIKPKKRILKVKPFEEPKKSYIKCELCNAIAHLTIEELADWKFRHAAYAHSVYFDIYRSVKHG